MAAPQGLEIKFINKADVLANLNALTGRLAGVLSEVAAQGLVICDNRVKGPGFPVVTGNLINSYHGEDRGGGADSRTIWYGTYGAFNNGYDYAPIVEYRKPYFRSGISVASEEIKEMFIGKMAGLFG